MKKEGLYKNKISYKEMMKNQNMDNFKDKEEKKEGEE